MLSPQSPWPGLRPFGEDDRSFFFGRERETADLFTLVQRSGVVIVYGQSGLGKTSLLQAGLFHALREVSLLPFRLRIDHGDAAPPAATQIKTALVAALDAAGVQGPRPGPDETLWEYFHRRDVDLWGPRNRLIKPVIAFDQFEEVFTLGQRSEKAMARVAGLVADLESLLEHRAPEIVRLRLDQRPDDALKYDFQHEGVKFIISLREDFLAQLDTWRMRMPSLLPNRFRLERMTGGQALDVVERAGGALVAPAVAKEIVDFVSRSQRRAQSGALLIRNVEPALLSVVCDELNRRRLNRNAAQITPDLLSGEREGIIAGFYARAFEDVEPRARDWVEDELLTVSGYRDRAAQEDALRLGIKEADLDKLVDRRILHREERDGVVWLELTHDLLTDPAYASHTQREQRRLAEEATRREAETAMRLRRTTRLAVGFGVLSLAMVVAVIYAFSMSRRAADAQASTQRALDRAVGAETQASAAATLAKQSEAIAKEAAKSASNSFSTAMGMAQPLGQTLREFVLGDMRMLTPAVLEIIDRTDESYKLLEKQDAAAPARKHAEFLVTAAQALCDVGHLTDGISRAEQAIAILDAHPSTEPGTGALRAEALYARGNGYSATGRMAQARKDLTAAIALAGSEARTATWTFELIRVNTLAELGLGELDRWALALDSAEQRYQRAIAFLAAIHSRTRAIKRRPTSGKCRRW
jgi:tetratricopeptide (TPR) repeat protein